MVKIKQLRSTAVLVTATSIYREAMLIRVAAILAPLGSFIQGPKTSMALHRRRNLQRILPVHGGFLVPTADDVLIQRA